MIRKRSSSAGKRKKKESDALNEPSQKRQTSLLSFFGKNPAGGKPSTKTTVTKSTVSHQIVKKSKPTKRAKSVPKPKSKKGNTLQSETSNVTDKHQIIVDEDTDQNKIESNCDRERTKDVYRRDFSAGKTLETTLSEEKSSVTITPCKGTFQQDENEDNSDRTKENNRETAKAKAVEANDESHTLPDSSSSSPIHHHENDENETPQSPHHGLSEYEKLRLRNIERNNARLAALGLLTTPANSGKSSSSSSSNNNRRRPPRKKAKVHQRAPQQPLRRSSRNRNAKPEATGSSTDGPAPISTSCETIPQPEVKEVEETYTVSPLLQYEMSRSENSRNENESSSSMNDSSTGEDATDDSLPSSANMSLRVAGPRFVPPKGLNAIYSLEFCANSGNELSNNHTKSNWLVGAGKAGMIALWDANTKSETSFVDPILSWKAHSGRWIADAKFLPGPTRTPSRLATAGNDGTVCLWDLSTVSHSTGAPKLLHRTGKSVHSSGIFSMDATTSCSCDVVICTGSKDKSVVVSSLDSLQQDAPLWRSDFHTAKVGAVQLRGNGSKLLLSASDDGLVGLHDYRSDKEVAFLEDAHDRPHSVVWDPLAERVFATAGLDPIVKLWDQRNLSKPLVCLQGHVPTSTTRCKRIHKPVFFYQSSFLLTGGQGSSSVSVYTLPKTSQGNFQLCSRGRLPEDCGDSGCIAVSGKRVAVTVDQGEILLLEPSRR